MRTKNLVLGAATALVLSMASATAQADILFSQDFSGGLSAGESVSGNFVVHDGVVGHQSTYSDNEYSYYQLSVDLTGATSAFLTFDYEASMESHFDRFNVLASTGAFAPPAGLITPISGLTYTDEGDLHAPELGQVALAASASGFATFDLASFLGGTVNIRMQFGSDGSLTSSGVNLDNVVVRGETTTGAIPEPATWALMILGFGSAGAMLRRTRPAVA